MRHLGKAVELYDKAARQGVVAAQYQLGYIYKYVREVWDYKGSFAWLTKAANSGYALAQTQLADSYARGLGVEKSEGLAASWYRRAADQGEKHGQSGLGLLYLAGLGVPKNETQAVDWFRKAALQGEAIAQYNLGLAYEYGYANELNPRLAYFWYLLASVAANKEVSMKARQRMIPIESKLHAHERLEAQNHASAWAVGRVEPILKPVVSTPTPPNIAAVKPPVTSRQKSSGSGFHIGRGYVVTNFHVVEGCGRLTIQGRNALLINGNPNVDLAVLRARNIDWATAKIRLKQVRVGEDLAVAGFPLSHVLSGFNLTRGNVSSLGGPHGNENIIQISAPVQKGNSGGPVVDAAGDVVAVVVSILNPIFSSTGVFVPQNVNFAIKNDVLRKFLNANNISYENSDVAVRPLKLEEVADKVRRFTVSIECY